MLKNSRVKTPLGTGIVQGQFAVNTSGELIVGVMVRLPVDDQTRGEMRKSNCLTPRAKISGLWVFGEHQLEAV